MTPPRRVTSVAMRPSAGLARRISRPHSQAATPLTTKIRSTYHQSPTSVIRNDSGAATIALTTRTRTELPSPCTEKALAAARPRRSRQTPKSALPLAEIVQCLTEQLRCEIRPMDVGRPELRVGRLPEQ